MNEQAAQTINFNHRHAAQNGSDIQALFDTAGLMAGRATGILNLLFDRIDDAINGGALDAAMKEIADLSELLNVLNRAVDKAAL